MHCVHALRAQEQQQFWKVIQLCFTELSLEMEKQF